MLNILGFIGLVRAWHCGLCAICTLAPHPPQADLHFTHHGTDTNRHQLGHKPGRESATCCRQA